MFAPFLRPLALVCCVTAAARANSLVSLTVSPLTAAAATAVVAEVKPGTFLLRGTRVPLGVDLHGQVLPGLDPALRPVTAAVQEGMLHVLARDATGALVLLRHAGAAGWQRRAAPTDALLPTAQPAGPSHLLFVAPGPGAGRLQLVAYHTITDTWAAFGDWDGAGTFTAVVPAGHGFVVTTRDAAGGLHFTRAELVSSKRGLKVIDYAVIAAYLCVVAGIGLYCYLTGKQDTATFFLAGRRIPWWAAGLSLYATGTSAISYLAIPAKSYATNWLYLGQNVLTFVGSIYVAFVIVPLVRRLNLTSVYQYLELRFHPVVRLMASFICIVQHLAGRMAIVLLLPALALSAVTGITVTTSILLMGVITTIYTFLGGMKAVIWTDVLQVFVMVGGALFAITWMVIGTGGVGAVARLALADGKTHLFDWRFDFTIPSAWIFVLMLLVTILTWPQDQTPDAARALDQGRQGGAQLGADAHGDRAAGQPDVLQPRDAALHLLQGASHAAQPAAGDRPDLPAVHRQRPARRRDRPDHRGHLRRVDGHPELQHQLDRHARLGGLLRALRPAAHGGGQHASR